MISNFKNFKINEGRDADKFENDVNDAKNLLELLIEDPEILKYHDEEFDYSIDSDFEGNGDQSVWIEITNAKPQVIEMLDDDYNSVLEPFKKFAEKHDLYNPEILSTHDSLSYSVTVVRP